MLYSQKRKEYAQHVVEQINCIKQTISSLCSMCTTINMKWWRKNDSAILTEDAVDKNNKLSIFITDKYSPNFNKENVNASSNSNVINIKDKCLDISSQKFIKFTSNH